MIMSVHNYHDAFFARSLPIPKLPDFLANYLPVEVRNQLDLNRVELEQDSFIDETLREHFADLIFRVPLIGDAQGGVVFVYMRSLNTKAIPNHLSLFSCCATWCACGSAHCAKAARCR